MKWLIRIACFIITTAIFIPIETALYNSGTNKAFIWIATAVIYFFVFFIPSRAIVAMHEKSIEAKTRAKQENKGAIDNHSQIPQDPFLAHERIYCMSTKDGERISVRERNLPGFYAAQYGEGYVEKAEELNNILTELSTEYVKAIHGKPRFREVIFYWCVFCKAVHETIEYTVSDSLLVCLFKESICGSSDLFKHVPSKMTDWLLTFFSKSYSDIKYCDASPLIKDGIKKLYALRPKEERTIESTLYEPGMMSEDEENMIGMLIYAHRAAEEAERLFRIDFPDPIHGKEHVADWEKDAEREHVLDFIEKWDKGPNIDALISDVTKRSEVTRNPGNGHTKGDHGLDRS